MRQKIDDGEPSPRSSIERRPARHRYSIRIYAATAFSSQPTWPQWQLSVIIFFVSSQCCEQYFLPTGAMQLQAMWAHLVGVFDIGPP